MKTVTQQHVEQVPGKCGGKPCIVGTRIRVWDIYVLCGLQGKTADEAITSYPQLSLSDVHAALAYYYDHKSEIDTEMKVADEYIEQLKASIGPGPLSIKLAGMNTGSDSVSP